jgi:hypothetical protein
MPTITIKPELLAKWYERKTKLFGLGYKSGDIEAGWRVATTMATRWLTSLTTPEEADVYLEISHSLFAAFYNGKIDCLAISVEGNGRGVERIADELRRAFGHTAVSDVQKEPARLRISRKRR